MIYVYFITANICIDIYYILKKIWIDLGHQKPPAKTKENCIMIIIDCPYVVLMYAYAVMYIIIMHMES